MAWKDSTIKRGSTKQRGDVAEYRVLTELLKRGHDVLKPIGDRLRYDLALDTNGKLVRIQIKRAYKTKKSRSYMVSIRRAQTNRKVYKFTKYRPSEFDYLVAWIPEEDVFYVIPSEVACRYRASVTLPSSQTKSQRRAKTSDYLNAWDLLV